MAELYKLSKYVLEELRENRIDKNTVISLIKKFNEREDIAIIGMGMKFSHTESYHDYWELLRSKQTVIERCSRRRIDLVRDHFPKVILGDEATYCKRSRSLLHDARRSIGYESRASYDAAGCLPYIRG